MKNNLLILLCFILTHSGFSQQIHSSAAEATETEKDHFFTPNDDYINLSEAYRENPEINELKIKNEQEYRNILQILSKEEKSVPLFIEINDNVYLVSEFEKLGVKKENFLFYYLGKEIEENYKSNSKD